MPNIFGRKHRQYPDIRGRKVQRKGSPSDRPRLAGESSRMFDTAQDVLCLLLQPSARHW